MMTKNIISLIVFIFIHAVGYANDSTSLAYDTASLEVRSFEVNEIEAYKQNPDFQYGNRAEEELSLWQRFKNWVIGIFLKLFALGAETGYGKLIVYLLCLTATAYAIYKLIRIRSSSLFYKERQGGLGYDVHHEDIHEMNFDQLIEEAVLQHNFRLAIRLVYLRALKHLSDRQLINWQPGKTNHEYSNELAENHIRAGFDSLSYYFDYAWYGDFKVDQRLYDKVTETFNTWKRGLT